MKRSLINQHRYSLCVFYLAVLVVTMLSQASCGDSATSKTQDPHANHQATSAAPRPTPRIPAHFNSPAEAKPLPAVLDPKQFSDPVIVKSYRYAQENPEIFAQQPCYCFCDAGENHRSLLDCFASSHGVGCALCQKESLMVHNLVAEGKNATEIRDLIVRGDWQFVKLE